LSLFNYIKDVHEEQQSQGITGENTENFIEKPINIEKEIPIKKEIL